MLWNGDKKEKRSLLERLVIIEDGTHAQTSVYDDSTYDPNATVVTVLHAKDTEDNEDTEEADKIIEDTEEKNEYAPESLITRPSHKNTYFDMLERAKELSSEDKEKISEKIRIVYTPPKRVYDAPIVSMSESRKRREARTYDISEIEGPALAPREKEEIREVLKEEMEQEIPETIVYRNPDERATETEIPFDKSSYATNIVASILNEGQERKEDAEGSAARVVPVIRSENRPAPDTTDREDTTGRVVPIIRLDKIIFPEEYFRARNGAVFKSAAQLHQAILEMDDDTFAHHAAPRSTNDFASWVQHVFSHDECAEKLSQARSKKEMMRILEEYL